MVLCWSCWTTSWVASDLICNDVSVISQHKYNNTGFSYNMVAHNVSACLTFEKKKKKFRKQTALNHYPDWQEILSQALRYVEPCMVSVKTSAYNTVDILHHTYNTYSSNFRERYKASFVSSMCKLCLLSLTHWPLGDLNESLDKWFPS